MATEKPYSSKEISKLITRWQPCTFFVMGTKETIITVSYYELFQPGSWTRCAPAALEKIKAALQQAYNKGVREVGFLCTKAVQEELVDLALTVTDDPTWIIYPHYDFAYIRNLLETKQKIWTEAIISADAEANLEAAEKVLCDSWGFTEEVLNELRQYAGKDFNELPPHLRKLFSESQEEEKE